MSGRWKPGEPLLEEPVTPTPPDSGVATDGVASRVELTRDRASSSVDERAPDASDGADPTESQVTLSRPSVPRPSAPRPSVPRPSVPHASPSRPNAPHLDSARTTQNRGLSSEIPHSAVPAHLSGHAPSFLDKLFVTFAGLKSDMSVEASVGALLGAFTEVFDEVAIGACIACGNGKQLTLLKSPRLSQPSMPDPARLFPELDHEWVIDLGEGSTLHLATDDESCIAAVEEPSSRLAIALRSLLERSNAFDALRAEQQNTEELRQQVIHSEKLASLGQIAAGIVHELNNPLTSILAYSDYLRRDWEKRGMASPDIERLRRINEAAERILTFTRDLIAYSRPTASVPGPVDVHEVLERALVFCEHVITTNQVVVDKTFGQVRLVSGVAGQLTQVFVNLFTNACQAMKDGGGHLAITTELTEDETRVFVTVSDEGHGIRDEHMTRLFEPYFTTKVDGAGTGLGLPIVQNIVKNHGGCISAKNHSGGGAIFTVELPVSARVTLFENEG